jgi:hypothetical protein
MEVLIAPDNFVIFPIGNKEALAQHIQTHGQELYRAFDKSAYGRAGKDGWSTLQDPYEAFIQRYTKNRKTANKPVVMPELLQGYKLATCVSVLLKILSNEKESEHVAVEAEPKRARYEFETIEELSAFIFNPRFPQLLKDSESFV